MTDMWYSKNMSNIVNKVMSTLLFDPGGVVCQLFRYSIAELSSITKKNPVNSLGATKEVLIEFTLEFRCIHHTAQIYFRLAFSQKKSSSSWKSSLSKVLMKQKFFQNIYHIGVSRFLQKYHKRWKHHMKKCIKLDGAKYKNKLIVMEKLQRNYVIPCIPWITLA